MDNQLKPCPFCGSDDTYTDSALGKQQVLCNGCEAAGPTEETDDEAIASWNRLAALPSDAPGVPNVEPTPLDDETVAVIRSFVDRPGETYRGVITRRLGIGFGRALRRAIEESRAASVAPAAVAPTTREVSDE
ncbi:Lar family restriction alleviation protein [Paraburkholderia sp. SIMBA_027]|uniref:Lar family restriction alleviation protein n=1 Tax=Paraburkholderia sp. SIMBA_027 TaxID=3085770 RepID=UPI003979C69F